MAATNIAGTITATYDASIPVPGDGDYANQAALIAMVKPIANRVAYLKERFEDAPWARSEFFDDFVTRSEDLPDRLLCDTLWEIAATNAASVTSTTDFDENDFGILRFSHSAGTVSSNLLSKGVLPATANILSTMSNFRRAVVRVRVGNIASGMNFEIGIDADSAHAVAGASAAITAIFQPSVSPNWQLRTHDGGSAVLVDTGVAVAANTWYQLDLQSDGSSVVSLSIDGAAAVQADPGDLPALTTDCAFVVRTGMPNAGASRTWDLDFVYGRFDVSSRVL